MMLTAKLTVGNASLGLADNTDELFVRKRFFFKVRMGMALPV